IVLVEQSADVALSIADRAVFLEKGEVRFHGPAAELRGRTDLLRAVFLNAGSVPAEPRDAVSDAHRSGSGLRTEGVGVSFGGNHAVDGVSIDIGSGEIVGIIGPNGAGKTTLFDILSGYLPPEAGRIHLGEVDVTAAGPHARARAGLGRSFQDARLFPGLTVEEAIGVA